MNNASVEFIDNLSQTASCYGLPYGIFGIVCWVITFSGTALTYANFPLFSPWQWGKDYKPQDPLLLVIIGGMVIGPTCYTCASCRAEWELILIALGQLSPFALKIISDGFVGEKKSYRTFGMILMVPLSILGWVGTTRLYIHLMHTTKVIPWIWIIYTVAITALVVACVAGSTQRSKFIIVMALYISATLHIITLFLWFLVIGLGLPLQGLA